MENSWMERKIYEEWDREISQNGERWILLLQGQWKGQAGECYIEKIKEWLVYQEETRLQMEK
ncbi:MAG: hypothetical protein II073_03415 [Lachnospiraceae bacterium]|nr:hypothetical protein [Lachnospiraceae bacterium]